MAEIEITGKQIGQLDALRAIDGSEKIPVETADGNGHVTTQQMREYAQPDLGGYATKSEVAEVKGSAVKSIMFSPGPAGNGMDVAVVRTDGSSDYDVAEIPLATTEKCGMMDANDKINLETARTEIMQNKEDILNLKDAIAKKLDAPERLYISEAMRIKKSAGLALLAAIGDANGLAETLAIRFAENDSTPAWRRLTNYLPAKTISCKQDATDLYLIVSEGGYTSLNVLMRGDEALECEKCYMGEIPAEATDVAETPSYEDFITKAEADGKYATKEEIPSVEGLLSESKAAETYQPIGDYATKEELGSAVAGKVGGTGVSAIEVVTELPAEPQDGVMYVVMG